MTWMVSSPSTIIHLSCETVFTGTIAIQSDPLAITTTMIIMMMSSIVRPMSAFSFHHQRTICNRVVIPRRLFSSRSSTNTSTDTIQRMKQPTFEPQPTRKWSITAEACRQIMNSALSSMRSVRRPAKEHTKEKIHATGLNVSPWRKARVYTDIETM